MAHVPTRHRIRIGALLAAFITVLLGAACPAAPAEPARPGELSAHARMVPQQLRGHRHEQVCQPRGARAVRCLSERDLDTSQEASPSATPQGYWPADLQAAYRLRSSAGAGLTVAVVTAFDAPTIEQDLATYRRQFNLPSCTSDTGCFRKVNQSGSATPLPSYDKDWADETSLDVEMVSAACPLCSILLVEAFGPDTEDLDPAEDTAASFSPVAISNSFGGAEDPAQTSQDDPHFDHPGIAVVASAGDSGYGTSYPAASRTVIAAGGTRLVPDSTVPRGFTESAWGGSAGGTGSGCSQFEPKPVWQPDTGCRNRMLNDLAAVADPATGVAVFAPAPEGGSAWGVFGGTSVSAPLIAGAYALAGPPGAGSYPARYLYQAPLALNDVQSGSNGSCAPAYWCTAVPGYDGPTGTGTPAGVAGLTPPDTRSGSFVPVVPHRILDTRDGTGGVRGPVPAGGTIRVKATGQYGVPATGIAAVVLNVTVTAPSAGGYVTVYPDGQPRPTASNLNFVTGQTVPNSVVAPVSPDGYVDLYDFQSAGASAQLVADISGYFLAPGPVAAGTFGAVAPGRILDTRIGQGARPGPVPAGSTIRVRGTGQYGVPDHGVAAVVLNVTVTEPTASGYLTAFPDGQPRPTASNLNFVTGQTVPNLVVVPVSADGFLDLYDFQAPGSAVQLVADVSGYFLADKPFSSGAFSPVSPSRILDTRAGIGAPRQPVPSGSTLRLKAIGQYGVPNSGVAAVVLNVTVTEPTAGGYLSVYPDDAGRPLASNLNFVPGQTVPNCVVVPVSADGYVDLYDFQAPGASVQLVADISGYLLR